jgi:hypothetical protein
MWLAKSTFCCLSLRRPGCQQRSSPPSMVWFAFLRRETGLHISCSGLSNRSTRVRSCGPSRRQAGSVIAPMEPGHDRTAPIFITHWTGPGASTLRLESLLLRGHELDSLALSS